MEPVFRKDIPEAVRWYRKAALKGDAIAQYNLGLNADVTDEVLAVTWFRLAAEQGHAPAQFALGELHERGKGVPQSNFEAFVFYSLASRHDNQAEIFGESKAKEVVQKRDRVASKLCAEQRANAQRRVAGALAAVHPRSSSTLS